MMTSKRNDAGIAAAFRLAAAHHQAGRAEEAAAAYRGLLVEQPGHPGVCHNLGLLQVGRGLVDEGLALLKAAFDVEPEGQHYCFGYVDALLHVGRTGEAEALLAHARLAGFDKGALEAREQRLAHMRDSMGRAPAAIEVQRLTELFGSGRHADLEAHARHLLTKFPDFAVAWKALGIALNAMARTGEAVVALRRCVELEPADAEAHNNLGSMLQVTQQPVEAEACFRRALRLQPGYVAAQNNLSVVLREQGRYAEAEAQLRDLLKRLPNDPLLHSNLGLVFTQQDRMPEAEVCFRKALEIRPDMPECIARLARVNQELGRLREAEGGFRRALELSPDLSIALHGLGMVALLSGRPQEAIELLQRALAQAPENLALHSTLLFSLNYAARRYDARGLDVARDFGRKLGALSQKRYEAWAVDPNAERLRIGFVSADLRRHPVGFFLEGILPVLDRSRLELIAYPTTRDGDVLTEQLKSIFTAWHPIVGLDDELAAARIHADGVHILIDLSGHTAHHRLGVFARKPAPVQVTWPGYFATTGVAEIDWFLADPVTVPETDGQYFTERIWHLPDTRLCFTPPVDAPPVAPLPMLRTGVPTFGSFQSLNKLNDEVLALWARVLDAVPGSRLRVQSLQLRNAEAQERLNERLRAQGVDPARVTLLPPVGRRNYLLAHSEVDLILDTFPYAGGTTTCEALWMGVPTLTLTGQTLIARQGASIMHAAGLSDWVVTDADEYVSQAVRLVGDPQALARMREGLRSRLVNEPLFDTPRFARNLERALWDMWKSAGNVSVCPPDALPGGLDSFARDVTDGDGASRMPSEPEITQMGVLFRDERHEDLAVYARSLTERYPGYGLGWKVLGVALKALERFPEALEVMQRAVTLLPEDVEAVGNLGLVLFELERFNEAAACHRQALALDPADLDSAISLSAALFRMERLDDVVSVLLEALERNPEHFDLHLRLAEAYWKQKKLPEAERHFLRATELGLNSVEAHFRLGCLLHEQRRYEEAEKAIRYALLLDPGHQRAKGTLGLVLLARNYHAEAEQVFREALAEGGEVAEHYCNLGSAVMGQGRLHEALDCYRHALELKPEWVAMHSNLLFSLNYAAEDDPQALYQEALAYGKRVTEKAGGSFDTWKVEEQPARLRVGFVSGDLCTHPVGYFLEGILPVLDRDRLELIAYPTLDRSDLLTEQLKSCFEAWRPLWALSDEAAAERIRDDGIHVLIDLSGHTAYNRLGAFARKPAPVQVSWPGYFATTGVQQIDWFVADRVTVPESHQRYFSERIWYLPETRLCFTPPLDAPSVSPLPMQRTGHVTFGCFQNLSKVNDDVLRVWAQVIQGLPGARLRLQSRHFNDLAGHQRMRERLAACGIDPECVSLHPGSGRREYLAAHAEVDLVLDTFPYTGGTTTCEALWMGVPTLTLRGDTLIARQGASIMQAAGLADWVVDNVPDYVQRAQALAQDIDGLAKLRAQMRQRLLRTALFDTPRFARQLEEALWQMWDGHVRERANNTKPTNQLNRELSS